MSATEKETRIFLIGWSVGVVLILATIFSAPYWGWSASTYTDDLGQEMPARGDVGWDDAVRLNYKILEAAFVPILEGHYVVEEPEVSGTTLVITWGPGWVYMNDGTGVSKYLPAGVTTIQNNTLNWLSAVTPGAAENQVIMQLRSGEYDIPNSGGSGFYHVPIAAITTEAGNVVRHKSLTFAAPWKYPITQPLNSGATPTFNGLIVTDKADVGSLNARGHVTLYATSNPRPTVAGQMSYDNNNHFVAVGDGTNTRAIPSGVTIYRMIASPDLLEAAARQPLWTNRTGTSFVITNASFRTSNSGTSLDMKAGASPFNYKYSATVGTNMFMGVPMNTVSGDSVYTCEFAAGTTVVPPEIPINMRYGGGSSADWLEITLGGYLEGNRP